MKLFFVWTFAVLFLIDSIIRVVSTNFNMGALLMYLITAFLLCYAFFHSSIDAFCAAGFGRFLKFALLTGCAVFAALMGFIAVSSHTHPTDNTERAAVVLGAGIHGTKVSGLLARRLDAAYEYHKSNPDAVLIVSGGQGPGEDITEAEAMKAYLVEKGVPAQQILEENKSVSTEENFLFSQRILAEHGISSDEPIVYITSGFHCYRAGKYASLAGFSDARSVPASIGITSILPCYMREALAVLYYWVFKA